MPPFQRSDDNKLADRLIPSFYLLAFPSFFFLLCRVIGNGWLESKPRYWLQLEISTYESVEIEIYMIRILEVGINLESSISS